MNIRVRLFGREADVLNAREVRLDLASEHITAAELREALAQRHAEHAPLLRNCRVALNHDFAPDDAVIRPDDEVALIGAVSGG